MSLFQITGEQTQPVCRSGHYDHRQGHLQTGPQKEVQTSTINHSFPGGKEETTCFLY